jgi:hypothetical protein
VEHSHLQWQPEWWFAESTLARVWHYEGAMAISIAELTAAGIQVEADEAVAIAQQLIELLTDPHAAHDVEPPYGPPSAETVSLNSDGTVVCRCCGTTPAVSEVGIFLHSLLRAGALRVPGGLRYTIARALLDVDVPPFDSLEDFSHDLARHEHGDRTAIVRRLLRRAGTQPSALVVPIVDRRTWHAPVTDLRRALREADVRLYEYQRQRNQQVLEIKAPPRGRTMTATAACLAAGLALICTGELMHRRTDSVVVPTAAPIAAQSSAPGPIALPLTAPVQPPAPAPTSERGIVAVRDVPSMSESTSRPEVRRIAVKRTKRPSTTVSRQSSSRPASRGVLDRLRLGWLRSAFSSRSSSPRTSSPRSSL